MKSEWGTYSSPLVEGKYEIDQLLSIARDAVGSKIKGSELLVKAPEKTVPHFLHSELSIGNFLGRGGFCSVHEISAVVLRTVEEDGDEDFGQRAVLPEANVVQDRYFMASNYRSSTKRNTFRYAIKRVHKSSIDDAQLFVNGVVDLAVEAQFLAVLRHPNIIKMRGMAATEPFHSERPFFIIIDKLDEILTRRIKKWKAKQSSFTNAFDCKGTGRWSLWFERLKVAYGIAKALEYVHSQCVIYRDIKPENIGFDVRGDVKLFDFGLAREIPPNHSGRSLFRLTGDTGSPRYMAPEVASGRPYNQLVDVYSFSILFWELLSLQAPFKNYVTLKSFHQHVVRGGVRPQCDPSWPMHLVTTIQNGWSSDIFRRPSITVVVGVIGGELNTGDDTTVTESQFLSQTQLSSDAASLKSAISYRRFANKSSKTKKTLIAG